MDKKLIEKWVWILIYVGILVFSVGWFVQGGSGVLGALMMAAGAIVAVIGAALIFVRARLGS